MIFNQQIKLALFDDIIVHGTHNNSFQIYKGKNFNIKEYNSNKYLKIILDSNSFLFLLGTSVDYKQNELSQKFIFINNNAKNSCGCGESLIF